MADTLDLDLALRECRSPLTRSRLDEAIRCYNAGAYRAAVTAIWTAIVYDLHEKLNELESGGDPNARTILRSWNRALEDHDIPAQMELEKSILKQACDELEIFDATEKALLERVREDRNLCAHPAMLADGTHFSPAPELVRSHLAHAVKFLFTQRPTQGKSILGVFQIDIESPGFPADAERGIDYVARRYLEKTRDAGIRNIGVICAKATISGNPPNIWSHNKKLITALRAIQQRRAVVWQEVEAKMLELSNNAAPADRLRCILLATEIPGFWGKLDDATRTALIATVESADWEDENTGVCLRSASDIQELSDPMRVAVGNLNGEKLESLLKHSAPVEAWPKALELFSEAGSFRGAEIFFSNFIAPFQSVVGAMELRELMEAINNNGQIWDAALIPSQLHDFAKGMAKLGEVDAASAQSVFDAIDERKRNRFDELWQLLAATSAWQVPRDDDDIPF